MTTVDTVQSRIAAVVDQDEDTDNISTDDYSLRLTYINRRERQWAEAGSWRCLYTEYNTLTSTSSGNTSISLPANFRKITSYPEITYDGSTTEEFPIVRGQEKNQYLSTDQYAMLLGNKASGFYLKVNPGTSSGQLASGASIYIPYVANPSSLASPSDTVVCPNPEYLTMGVIADVWQAREDARFQQSKVEANRILLNMLEQENTPSEANQDREVRTVEETRHGFRIGRD